jgi:hypothetical protein
LHQFDQIVDARAADDKTQPRSAHFSALVAERPDLYADYREFMFGSN